MLSAECSAVERDWFGGGGRAGVCAAAGCGHVVARRQPQLSSPQLLSQARVEPHFATKEEPQPQEEAALGFAATTKAERIRSDS